MRVDIQIKLGNAYESAGLTIPDDLAAELVSQHGSEVGAVRAVAGVFNGLLAANVAKAAAAKAGPAEEPPAKRAKAKK